jgi:hypothetical protein
VFCAYFCGGPGCERTDGGFQHRVHGVEVGGGSVFVLRGPEAGAFYGYQALREVLELGEDVDFLPDEDGKVQSNVTSQIPLTHKNIRGREYYKKDKQ